MPEVAPSSPTTLWRILLCLCAVLLLAVTALLSRLSTQRAELATHALRASLAEQEARALRQQLEAERILAAAQLRQLRDNISIPQPAPPAPDPANPPP